jgi:hypothetical protein
VRLAPVAITLGTLLAPMTGRAQQPVEQAPASPPHSSSVDAAVLATPLLRIEGGLGLPAGDVRLSRGGVDLRIGYFGQGIDEMFGDVPASIAAARRYRAMRIATYTLTFVNFALILAGTAVWVDQLDRSVHTTDPQTGLYLAAAGSGCVSMLLYYLGNREIQQAVELHNDAIRRRASASRWRFGVAPSAVVAGGLATFTGVF